MRMGHATSTPIAYTAWLIRYVAGVTWTNAVIHVILMKWKCALQVWQVCDRMLWLSG
jgi:hypothetical protein